MIKTTIFALSLASKISDKIGFHTSKDLVSTKLIMNYQALLKQKIGV
ncbi:MAG: hypothetical protein AB8U53_01345 [Rickettsia aeschlimannii]